MGTERKISYSEIIPSNGKRGFVKEHQNQNHIGI